MISVESHLSIQAKNQKSGLIDFCKENYDRNHIKENVLEIVESGDK